MNFIENITTINKIKLLRRCDTLPLVSQALSVVMYIIVVIKWSRPSAAAHIDSFVSAVPHVEWKRDFFYQFFSGRRF
jgi:hypothetical protein